MTPEESLLSRIRAMWRTTDPAPHGLAERALFAVELEQLDAEVPRMQQAPVLAARAGDPMRAVTFTTGQLSMLISFPFPSGDQRHLDGWIAPGAGLRIELRLATGARYTTADGEGRFSFSDVPHGPALIVLHPTEGAAVALTRPIITPTFSL
ncbi:MAG: hypothetical protein QOJ50_73 [Cryptosporangiaceae bacterium]|nr:hypothetical protein [Cryptosporangiaceae bacterium]